MIIVSETIENYIYCRVIFEENGKSYYYLTDDEEIKPLDLGTARRQKRGGGGGR